MYENKTILSDSCLYGSTVAAYSKTIKGVQPQGCTAASMLHMARIHGELGYWESNKAARIGSND